MANYLAQKSWSPYVVGVGIGILTWFAFATADHPIGITTAFEHSAALAAEAVHPPIKNENPYFAEKIGTDRPKIGWEWMLVVGVFVGSLASSLLSGDRARSVVPELWAWRFGPSKTLRLVVAFLGGMVMMLGARLAQGCTSGHGISGTLQLAVSSWVFILTAFAVGIVTTFAMYGREARHHV